MTAVTKTLGVRREPDGLVHETESTSTSTWTDTTVTKAWLAGDRVHVSIGPGPIAGLQTGLVLGSRSTRQSDHFSPDDAEHLAKLLLDLAQQARAVQARKPWTGGPLGGTRRG